MTDKNNIFSLSPQKISAFLDDGTTVRVFDIIDSTNNEAKRMLESGFRGKAIVVAETQTSGRGRLGRSFYSPKSTGLYFTVIVPPVFPVEDVSLLTPAAAVSVTRTLGKLTSKELKIKWVNDIYVGDKKICGILAESVLDIKSGTFAGFAVGIGINLCTEDFPEDIAGIAASLGTAADRNEIAAGVARELFAFVENLSAREFLPEYRDKSYVTGKEIYFVQNGEKTNATALGIDDFGGLVVRLENGETEVLRGGEISVRIR